MTPILSGPERPTFFLEKVPAWYRGGKQQRQQLYSQDHNPKGVGTPSFLNNYSRSSPSSNCSKQVSNSRYCMYLEQIKHCFIPYCWPSVTAHGSQAALLLAQLESYHIRPLGTASGSGFLTGVDVHPILRGALCPLSSQHQPAVEEEVQKLLTKGAIRKVEPCPGQFVSMLFLIAKKDGSFQPVVNLRPSNQFMARAHFKMEGINMMKDLLLENDWMASIDLKDAYLLGSKDRTQEVPPFCLGKTDIRVPVPSILIGQCTKGIHQAPEAGRGSPQPLRDSPCDFLGQHPSAGPVEGRFDGLDGPDSPVVQYFGFSVNLEKSQLTSAQQIQFLGFVIRLSEFDDLAHTGEDRTTNRNLQGHQTVGEFNSARLSRLIGRMTATSPAILQASLRY